MDWSQVVYLLVLAAAIYTGRPAAIIIFAMVGNFLGTAFLAQSPLDVAIADLVSIILLIGASKRANVVAALFVAMIPIYLGAAALGLQPWVAYTAVDILAVLQCGVIGGWDRGIGRMVRRLRDTDRRGAGGYSAVAQRRYALHDVRVSEKPDRRG